MNFKRWHLSAVVRAAGYEDGVAVVVLVVLEENNRNLKLAHLFYLAMWCLPP